jgi:hypothetical protein
VIGFGASNNSPAQAGQHSGDLIGLGDQVAAHGAIEQPKVAPEEEQTLNFGQGPLGDIQEPSVVGTMFTLRALRDVCEDGNRSAAKLGREPVTLLCRKSGCRSVDSNCELPGGLPNTEISKTLHS